MLDVAAVFVLRSDALYRDWCWSLRRIRTKLRLQKAALASDFERSTREARRRDDQSTDDDRLS